MPIPEYPINPTEQYLARLAEQNAQLPDHPITRTHQYLEALVGTAGKLEADFNAEILGGTVALTERVDGGTLLKNQLWVNKTCAVVGYVWDSSNSRFRLYCVFATNEGSSVKTWLLYERDSESEPYELTMETAPNPFEVSASDMYKLVQNMSCVHHVDVRFCREVYDADNNLMYRIYSAQYRYAVDNGVASRTKVSTAPQNSSFIIDIGLKKATASMRKTYNYKSDNEGAVLPLVSDNQNVQYQFIIPDSMFSEATYGLSVVTVMGNGWGYYGPTFDKAEDTGPLVVNLTPTAQDFSGTMDKTGDDILEAYFSGRRIRFVVQGFSAGADATMFNLLDDGAGGIAGVIASAFVVYDAGSGWMNILISSGAYDNTYTTTIFQLTPIT